MHSLEGWQANADARQFDLLLIAFPASVQRNCLYYLALFRPRSEINDSRGLAWPKALRIMTELKQLIELQHIQWKGQAARSIDMAIWSRALEQVVENPPPKLPLKSHGYLTAVAYDLANTVSRSAEVKHNRDERAGRVLPAEERQTRSGGELEPVLTPEMLRSIREKNMGKGRRKNGNRMDSDRCDAVLPGVDVPAGPTA